MNSHPDIGTRAAFAVELAEAAGKVIKSYFRQPGLHSQTKSCVSAIVTQADEEAESRMRELIVSQYPNDGIIGEEHGSKPSSSGYSWVLDPIDGTSSFVRAFPIFGTLIGCIYEDINGDRAASPNTSVLIGVLDQPVLGERLVGTKGQTTTFNGRPITCGYQDESLTLEDACLTSTTPFMFISDDEKRRAYRLQEACRRKAFGGDCYSYAMLAAGQTAMPLVILEADLKYYDFCALIPILEGAKAHITDWSGQPLQKSSTQVVAAPSKHLLKLALAKLA